MDVLRLFVAIELPPNVRAVLVAAQRTLAAQGLAVRWVDPDGTHLTLKFLGSVGATQVADVTAAMARAASAHRPFTLRTTSLGAFPGLQQPRVVWLGIDGDLAPLGALQRDVERHITPLGYPSEFRDFNPHLTLGRTHTHATAPDRTAIGQALVHAQPFGTATWQVDAVSLMRSERGPERATYTSIAHHSLTEHHRLL